MSIPDVHLEQAVRTAISKPTGPLTESDLCALTTLAAPSVGISDLSGRGAAVNLQYLYLDNNLITDLSPLAGLGSLQYLTLSQNDLADMSTLPA